LGALRDIVELSSEVDAEGKTPVLRTLVDSFVEADWRSESGSYGIDVDVGNGQSFLLNVVIPKTVLTKGAVPKSSAGDVCKKTLACALSVTGKSSSPAAPREFRGDGQAICNHTSSKGAIFLKPVISLAFALMDMLPSLICCYRTRASVAVRVGRESWSSGHGDDATAHGPSAWAAATHLRSSEAATSLLAGAADTTRRRNLIFDSYDRVSKQT
jgi:hypothetical protein